jgi:hypothetical protein
LGDRRRRKETEAVIIPLKPHGPIVFTQSARPSGAAVRTLCGIKKKGTTDLSTSTNAPDAGFYSQVSACYSPSKLADQN